LESAGKHIKILVKQNICAVEGDYLRFSDHQKTYKIYLGSNNVLREPGERYLCIVADPPPGAVGGRLYVSIEGDVTLTLILSKALLLPQDHHTVDDPILCLLEH
jgi:hypothetical protein